ncbi:MAG TPA: tetratricopeptide repeat protein, partial [Saprospiraceae bacterium]|nr:tetratricopeptide repeat protein [Saprospiraceae bacterium]
APFDAGLKGPGATVTTASTFFAYNDREVRQGQRDFQRQWGNRPLEDNWRRSAKGFSSEAENAGPENAASTASETTSAGPLTDAEIKELLGNFPSTEEEVAQVHLKLKEAMFNLGKLYRDKLNRLDKSVEILERLNQRFPANNYELESWYLLYLLFTDMNNSPKAKEYADKIINKYPTSVYGKVLQDPGYVQELADERRRLNIFYDQAYAKFQNEQYQQAFDQCQQAKEKFGAGNPLQPKFALLSAMCMGNLQGKNAYVAGLNEVMSKYPNTPEQTRAREMLRLISGASAALPGGQTDAILPEGELYKDEPDDLHYVIIYLDKTAPIDKSRNQLSDYNQKYHDLDKLRIANVFLGASNEIPVLVLRRFKDKKESMRYIQGAEKNAQDFLNKSEYGFTVLSISQNNYRNLLRDKRT